MRRSESAFTINGLVFLNPRSRAQVYLLGGFGWAGARVYNDNTTLQAGYYYPQETHYGYFGGQAGGGLEFRVAKHFALNLDLRGFVRGRIDENAQAQPEFRDPVTGRTTNTSGGGIITGGMTVYF